MRHFLTILTLGSIFVAAQAQAEDAEHRADRLYTQQLNRRAKAETDHRDAHMTPSANAYDAAAYRAARAQYQQQMEAWRQQVAACRGGDYNACDR